MDFKMSKKKLHKSNFTKNLVALKKKGKLSEIIEILNKHAYQLNSENDALFISEVYEKSGLIETAYQILTGYLQKKTPSILSLRYLGFLSASQSDFGKASQYLEAALKIEPENGDILQELGKVRLAANRISEAFEVLQAAIEQNAKNKGSVFNDLSQGMRQLGRHEEEIEFAKKAINFDNDNKEYRETLASAYIASGKKEEAFALFDDIIFSNKEKASSLYNLVRSKKFTSYDQYYDQVMERLKDPALNTSQKALMNYAAGHIESNLKNYERAVTFWNAGGSLTRDKNQFTFIQEQQRFFNIYQTFGKKIPKLSLDDLSKEVRAQKPVFIVGMPRSGTTLLESIIAAHSKIHGAGELENLGQIINNSNFFTLKTLLPKNMLQIRNLYHHLNRYRVFKQSIFTDKMPLNFRFIGFILKAFPDAKIIHIKRDPIATCFSNFQRNFKADGMTFTATQTDIAKYYKLYVDLMDFWNNLYKGKFLEIQYEDLTEDIETKSQEIFKFLELDYETQVLNFHKQKRSVLTASQDQVRQGIYKNSSQAWKNYEPWLSPMLDQLSKDQLI